MTSPGHPVTTTGLITDRSGRVLILRPAHALHEWWFLPGALVPDQQEPAGALRAALWHQLRLNRRVGRLHLLAYKPCRAERDPVELVLLFDCGTGVDTDALQQAGLFPGHSVAMWRWATPTDAGQLLEPDEAQRVEHALRHPGSGNYLIQPHYHEGGADDADDAAGRRFASVGSPS
jgi:8-oxo-dGTP diphosphatase